MDKVQQLLRSLRPNERKRFVLYLESGFVGVPRHLFEFGQGILSHCEASNWELCDSKTIWEDIFPGQPYNDRKWRKRKSELLKVLYAFVRQEQEKIDRPSLLDELELLQALAARGEAGIFEKNLKQLSSKLTGKHRSGAEILVKVRIYETAYNFFRERQNPNKENPKEAFFLGQREKALNDFFLFEKLKTATALENRRLMEQTIPEIDFPVNFDAYVQMQSTGEEPLYRIFSILLLALRMQQASLFLEFENELMAHHSEFDQEEKQLLFNFAINHAVRAYLISPGNENALRLFALYRECYDSGTLTNQWDEIATPHFKNLISLGIRLGEVEFAERILKKYKGKLLENPENRSTVVLCEAMLFFSLGEFKHCQNHLRKIDSSKQLKIDLRIYEMKAHYELEEWDFLENKIQSFERLLQRSSLPESRVLLEQSWLRCLKKILQIAEPGSEKMLQLKEEILAGDFHDANWLLKKLAEKRKP
ncbi:MAG TPA: hypothetical protein ENJ82_01480 [Bacteroidetes bacterium]|nr:hypothetical protein [Bacteroidota bacterium]